MREYHMEKTRRRVLAMTRSGAEVAGDMFLQPYGRYGGGPERPIDILNAAESYFPLRGEGGETVLLAKNNIVTVSTELVEDDDETESAIARPMKVQVALVDGKTIEATVLLEVPQDHPRLLDYLNLRNDRFLPFSNGEGSLFINCGMIERVRPVD
jgi:hypothetical protein